MSKFIDFRDNADKTVIPVANGTFYADAESLDGNYNYAQVYFEFYSDANGETPVTPTAGTLTVAGSPLGNNFIRNSGSVVINASDCQTPDSSYTPPELFGAITAAKVVVNGVTGAAYFRAKLWSTNR